MSRNPGSKMSNSGGLLPILALVVAQLLSSSWHVLGKHVFEQVPYLAPISFVAVKALISSLLLLIVGNIHECHVPFPPLFRDEESAHTELRFQVQLLNPSSSRIVTSSPLIESGNSVGLSLSRSHSTNSFNGIHNGTPKKVEDAQPMTLPLSPKNHHHHRPRRKKRLRPTIKHRVVMAIRSVIPSLWMVLRKILFTFKIYQQHLNNLNPDTIQIIFAGLSGMFLLSTCYTTGLIMTSPTVASVWDGPLIPLGCFCAAVTLGLEKRSKLYPFGQVGSLLLTVGGSIVVLLVDYLGGGHGISGGDDRTKDAESSNGGVNEHLQFIQGNMILMGVVASYSATALLQKQLNHYPPIQLTGWMFMIGFLGCLTVLMLESILGSRIIGCTLGQAFFQLYTALTTSPTFRYGLIYSAFSGGACFSIVSYASSHLESSVITLFAATQPPITALLELIWEGKGLGWKKIAGMGCVGIGMWAFTYIKRVEMEERIDNHRHRKKKKGIQNHAHLEKAQFCENGNNVQAGCSEVSPNGRNDSSSNLTNRKAHADV